MNRLSHTLRIQFTTITPFSVPFFKRHSVGNIITENPAHGATLPKTKPVRKQHVLTYEQAQNLLGVLALRARTVVGLALSTGARRGELFALRWRHFDAETRTLSICEAVYDAVIDLPKTDDSVRDIPLPEAVVRLLQEWRTGSKYQKPDDFIFAGRLGIPGDNRVCFEITSNQLVRVFRFRMQHGSHFDVRGQHGRMEKESRRRCVVK